MAYFNGYAGYFGRLNDRVMFSTMGDPSYHGPGSGQSGCEFMQPIMATKKNMVGGCECSCAQAKTGVEFMTPVVIKRRSGQQDVAPGAAPGFTGSSSLSPNLGPNFGPTRGFYKSRLFAPFY